MTRRSGFTSFEVVGESTLSSFSDGVRSLVLSPGGPATGNVFPPPLKQGQGKSKIQCLIDEYLSNITARDGTTRRNNPCQPTTISSPADRGSSGKNMPQQAATPISFIVNDRTVTLPASLPPSLILAVINQESLFNPDAISTKDCVGLMQISKVVAKLYGCRDRRDPQQNINAGSAYLADLIRQFEGNLALALAAYNWGPPGVVRLLSALKKEKSANWEEVVSSADKKNINIPEQTKEFVKNVQNFRVEFEKYLNQR